MFVVVIDRLLRPCWYFTMLLVKFFLFLSYFTSINIIVVGKIRLVLNCIECGMLLKPFQQENTCRHNTRTSVLM